MRSRDTERHPKPTRLRPTARRVVSLVALLMTLLVARCSVALTGEPGYQEPVATEPPPAQEPTEAPDSATDTAVAGTATPGPTLTPVVVEAAPSAPESEALGEIDFEYPIRMAPLAGDTAILHVAIPEVLAAAEPEAVTRVEAQSSVEGNPELGRFDAVVYVAASMRAELASPGLEVTPIHPADQPVALDEIDQPTSWAWTLRAPETPGKQVMTLSLYRTGEAAPVWVGSFRVDVVAEPTPTVEATAVPPTPTATPAPTTFIQQIGDALAQDFTNVLLGFLGLIGTIVAALIAARAERRGQGRRAASAGEDAPGQSLLDRLRALWFRLGSGSSRKGGDDRKR